MPGPHIITDGGPAEHVWGPFQSCEILILGNPVIGIRVVLKFMCAEPLRRMVEWVDCSPSSNRAIRADCAAGSVTTLVHTGIFARDHVGTKLRVPIEIKRAFNGRSKNARAGTDANPVVQIHKIAGSVLKTIHKDFGKFHPKHSPRVALA